MEKQKRNRKKADYEDLALKTAMLFECRRILLEESRNQEIKRAVTDSEYQKKLFEEFHI